MSDKVVETIYGKHNKYEIIQKPSTLIENTKYYIYKDSKPYRGSFSSLRDAVDAAKSEK